jgi:hypothetical protein
MLVVIRLLLLLLLVVLFVTTLVALFSAGTGVIEKVVLAAIGILLVLAVPRVQRLGSSAPR